MPKFELNPAYTPTADQPKAIEGLAEGLGTEERVQTLLGATGTGKTFTMAATIAEVQRPALVIAHNKTLAAQLCNEFREFFPKNAVEYFVSYYDYYQPEAYVPAQDLYIEKDSSINDEIDRLRHSATASLFARKDVIIVASVSCIYGIGSPQLYKEQMQLFKVGEWVDREELFRKLVGMQYRRNDTSLGRGTFSARGETLEIFPAYAESAYRIQLFGDEIEAHPALRPADRRDPRRDRPRLGLAGEPLRGQGRDDGARGGPDRLRADRAGEAVPVRGQAARGPQADAADQVRHGDDARAGLLPGHRELLPDPRRARRGRPAVHADRLLPRRLRHLHRRVPPDDSPDRRHAAGGLLAQVHAGRLRLPTASAIDNRPLKFDEFLDRVGQMVLLSATPGPWERAQAFKTVEQIVRPTGIVDPEVEVRETRNQIDDLMNEVRERAERDERVLVTTLTKKMAEDLTEYLLEHGFRVRYLHSEVDTLERIQIIRELRLGEYDVLVGVNLLREGLDLPEVSLVGILDADKEGFLRGETSLIQTIGRAARNVRGKVLMYADKETDAMRKAIGETDRRRAIQVAYNEEHGITPATVKKGISDMAEFLAMESNAPKRRRQRRDSTATKTPEELEKLVVELEEEMLAAAEDLRFEEAARIRDELKELKRDLDAIRA